jgi:hypothetical protein
LVAVWVGSWLAVLVVKARWRVSSHASRLPACHRAAAWHPPSSWPTLLQLQLRLPGACTAAALPYPSVPSHALPCPPGCLPACLPCRATCAWCSSPLCTMRWLRGRTSTATPSFAHCTAPCAQAPTGRSSCERTAQHRAAERSAAQLSIAAAGGSAVMWCGGCFALPAYLPHPVPLLRELPAHKPADSQPATLHPSLRSLSLPLPQPLHGRRP